MTIDFQVCYSGGAKGADTLWGEEAAKVGHEVVHWGFLGMKSSQKIFVLNERQLVQADQYLKEVNKILKRKFPTRSVYVNNLLRRNYYQIAGTQRVYAVSYLQDGLCVGGTGWAVHMAIIRDVPEVYVFDQADCQWYRYTYYEDKSWEKSNPPKPYGRYTGIGSVEITNDGMQAIREIYC